MKKKENIFLILLVVIFLIFIVGVSTYAYFESTTSLENAELNTLTKTAGSTTFTGYSTGTITVEANSAAMTEANVSTDVVDQDNATITVRVDSENEGQTTTCTYDLVWVWDSADIYTEPDATLPYTDATGKEYPYELSIKIGDGIEQDLSTYTWNGKEAIIGSKSITASGERAEDTYAIDVQIYNIPVVQTKLFNKRLDAHIEIRNNVCITDVGVIEPEPEPVRSIATVCNNGDTMSNCIKNFYTEDGEDGLYLHDGVGTYTNASLEAEDNSLRYSGGNPNNFVCFGDDCSNYDNLYRIIGIFDNQVKLIKADYANSNLLGTNGDYSSKTTSTFRLNHYLERGKLETINNYYWNYLGATDDTVTQWEDSYLNNVNLNTNYMTNIGNNWASMIAETKWVISGGLHEYMSYDTTAKQTYNYEIAQTCAVCTGKTERVLSKPAKIGLMYVSEYMYGASPQFWSYSGGNETYGTDYRSAIRENWLFLGDNEWTISPITPVDRLPYPDPAENIFGISISGGIGATFYANYDTISVRPTFSLLANVKYNGGVGTSDNPIRITL